jgi:hypothetical protein
LLPPGLDPSLYFSKMSTVTGELALARCQSYKPPFVVIDTLFEID